MGQIAVLDQNMVNMIAAGEVIERPASVVKELMENSIDTGATKITVSVEDGGKRLISVADNGCGMDAEDLSRAFEPHATSKIKTSGDLLGISTLGFRGEALASIASVAQVKAVSRNKGTLVGNCIEIDCGRKGHVGPCGASLGTTIQVRELFYKLPARRKFLKTANTESSHITEQFIRIALANRTPEMTLIHNGKEVLQLAAGQSIRQRIAALFSPVLLPAEQLIETQTDEKGLHITALLGKPAITRTNNKLQHIFLNGRFIRDKFISHAIREAYRGHIEPARYPVVFLFIEMPYEDYDVNVHPTKIEVRFYNSNLVYSQILAIIRERLLGTNLETEARIPAAAQTFSAEQRERVTGAMAEFFKRHRPIQRQQQVSYQMAGAPRRGPAELETAQQDTTGTIAYDRKFIQIHDSFIVAQTDEGFVIIDQHALHERITYERLRRRTSAGKLESQKLLIPETFELSDAEADILTANAELIERLGIELVPFGPKTMAIQAFPSLLAKAEPLDFVRDLIDLLEAKSPADDAGGFLDEVLNMAACKAAIKAGQKLTDGEIEELLAEKEAVEYSERCPHGRPTTLKFTLAELEKQFKRT